VASEGTYDNNSVRCILYLLENHSIKLKAPLGDRNNNYVEFITLILLLKFDLDNYVRKIQVFGD